MGNQGKGSAQVAANKGGWKSKLVRPPNPGVGPRLTRREYFAAAALAGLCTDGELEADPAEVAVDLADRLIAALNRSHGVAK